MKTYKVALGTEPVGGSRDKAITVRRKVSMCSTRAMRTRSFTNPFTSHIQTRKIKHARQRLMCRPAATSSFMDYQMDMARLAQRIVWRDWTDGCIAVTDSEIDEIWSLVKNGTPIEIKP